ncbi:MAG: ribulokinase [Oscillospiraceae bacterium]|nr:ribulokinase [Oscillospiraceae bacterium]
MKTYTIGIDFGTLSGRCVLVDCENGQELAEAVSMYAHGVMDDRLPSGRELPPQFALQHPEDYLDVLRTTVREVLEKAQIPAEQVVGIGIDFTSCTVLPVNKAGVPLCMTPAFADEPHAYVKLWKHHAAQPEADELNELAARRKEPWLLAYGGRVSSEWALPKLLETLRNAPAVYAETARFMEAADWIVSTLIGEESCSRPFAGYKALYHNNTYPSNDFMVALDKGLDGVVGTKISECIAEIAAPAGRLCAAGAALTGLNEGTVIAVPQIDAHAAMPALQITEAGELMLIMGTSACHIVNAEEAVDVSGICGYVENGVIPGLVTYEAGQAAVGDIFDWFVKNCVPARYQTEADSRKISLHTLLTEKAELLAVGQTGLIALDWFNGNRSVLDDSQLSGMILGLDLSTKPEHIYRALLEATAFGTKKIVDALSFPIHTIKVAGGIANKNPLLMQIYADVLGKELGVCQSTQAAALGSAIYAATAAGIYPDIASAAKAMGTPVTKLYHPSQREHQAYELLYKEYVALHDYFGRDGNDVMKRLLSQRHEEWTDGGAV